MNDWKPPIDNSINVRPHDGTCELIWIGNAAVKAHDAVAVANGNTTSPEMKAAIENALQIQSQRGLVLSMGFVN